MARPENSWQRHVASLSLRSRLTWLVALCAGLAATLGMVAVVVSGWWLQQERARQDTEELVQTLALTLQAPLAFDDAKGVHEALSVLRARPAVTGAWALDAQRRLMGHHGSEQLPPTPRGGGLAQGRIIVEQPVELDGARVGSLVLQHDLTHLWKALLGTLAAVGLASTVGFAATLTLARRLARGISQPVADLARAARAMSDDPASVVPLQHRGEGEIADALDAFNRMRSDLAARDAALLRANRELEQRVSDRTAALRREKERAEAASVAKTRFLANMSHELRTPLNAVIGAAQLLQAQEERAEVSGAEGPTSQVHLVEVIRQSGLNLLGLIENVLDISRIETGSLELSTEDFNLLDCVEAAMATAAVPARVKGLAMACIVDPRLPMWRHGDPLRLRQVLLNLLGNAVKFTLQGEVVLRLEPGDQEGALSIRVSDTGIGIPEASLETVFEPFRQADDGSSRRFGGSGLGLAIARQLVEAMGGRIRVSSRLGEGSTFVVDLVLPVLRDGGADAAQLGHDVALYEPHDASAQALSAQLQRLGCSTWRCTGPQELLEWLERRAPGSQMPWLLAALESPEAPRLLELAASRIGPQHIVGMSNGESLSTEAMRQRLTVPRGVIKPVLRSSLVSRLGGPRSGNHATIGTPSWTPQANASGCHVLVVEDDRVNQAIVCAMLRNAGYLTTTADDGAQALALLNCHDYDLVLMDWQMPDMDGLEVTRRMRAGEAGRHGRAVPIVALTANAFVEDRHACLSSGMNDFLTKPVLAASLEATVGRWTQHRRRNVATAPAATMAPCSSSNSCAPKATPAAAD